MSAYSDFAYVYDELQGDVPYEAWIDFYEKIWEKYNHRPTLLLDAGCGTGTVSCLLAEKGIEVIGCDASSDMLTVANEKAAEMAQNRPMFVNQSFARLDLYGTVDGVVSSLDCMNYLRNEKELTEALSRIALFCEPEALVIFDMNTEEKLQSLHEKTIVKEGDGVYCVWQNTFDKKSKTCRFEIDLFVADGEEWYRTREEHTETAFSESAVKKCIAGAGLTLLEIRGPEGEIPETEKERKFYICKR